MMGSSGAGVGGEAERVLGGSLHPGGGIHSLAEGCTREGGRGRTRAPLPHPSPQA